MLPLQFGVELSITKTSQYIEMDIQMESEAIEGCIAPAPGPAGESP